MPQKKPSSRRLRDSRDTAALSAELLKLPYLRNFSVLIYVIRTLNICSQEYM